MERLETPKIVPSYYILDDPISSDPLWTHFEDAVRKEGWRGCDNAMLKVVQGMSSTHAVFAQSEEDNKMMGFVVWHESKVMAWIGFYYVNDDYRGNGLGSTIWKRALNRIPNYKIIGLRSEFLVTVAEMADNYKKTTTPYEADVFHSYYLSADQILGFCAKYSPSPNSEELKLIGNLTDDEFRSYAKYDELVTGMDRTAIVRKYFSFEDSEGSVLIDKSGNVVAQAAIVETGYPSGGEFKFQNLFCDDIHQAAKLLAPLMEFSKVRHSNPNVIIYLPDETEGDKLVAKLKEMFPESMTPGKGYPTLYSREYKLPLDTKKSWLPPNANLLCDA